MTHSMMKTAAISAASWFIGAKIHSKRAVKKANKKSQQDLQGLYSKYIQDVTALQNQNAELEAYIKQSTRASLEEEFLRADIDNNKLVSRAEYEMNKKQYLQKHPEFRGSFPKFEDFDPDGNGMISMREHDAYYEQRGMI
jgi:phage-related minor tail protein